MHVWFIMEFLECIKVKNYDFKHTLHFVMFSVITNIYNKETIGPSLVELFTATEKVKKFFWQLEIFDVCTKDDTAHIYKIVKFLPHTQTRVWQQIDAAHIENL